VHNSRPSMDRTFAVLLTLLALRFTFFFVRGHFIMIHLAKTLQHVMVHKLQDYAPSSTMVYWIVWPQIVAAAIVMPMFITFLPNAAGVATTAPEQLEMYLRATWICFIVIVTVHGVSIIPITWTVHTTVSDSIAASAKWQNKTKTKKKDYQSGPIGPLARAVGSMAPSVRRC